MSRPDRSLVLPHLESDRTRRQFLCETALTAGAAWALKPADANAGAAAGTSPGRLKVAALFSHFTEGSHSELILENFLEPYMFNGEQITPQFDVVSFYIDKFPSKDEGGGTNTGVGIGDDDIGRQVALNYGIPLFPTISDALCLGTGELAVDAVLSIGEYGYRPVSALSDREFPRKRFLNEMAAVMRRSKRVVPVFNDKNLSYRWDWGREMYDTARELGIPLMAGSSVPLAQRTPELELPQDAEFEEIMLVHGGGLEGYDFHAMEALQSLAEGRKGGETGVSRVQHVSGDAVWKAADEGRWSVTLAEAAFEAGFNSRRISLRNFLVTPPRAILIDYKDGFRGTALSLGGTSWSAALRLKGEDRDRATCFYSGPSGRRSLFPAQAHAIQTFFVNKTPPYPVERTLWVGGIMDAAMHSYDKGGEPVATPYLEFGYPSVDWSGMRATGRNWERITSDTAKPVGLRKDPPAK